jgi:hypothetical protein
MKIETVSAFDNSLGLLGAIWQANAGVREAWRAADKYTILRMDYGLSIKNHNGRAFPVKDIKAIAAACIPGRDYKIERDENILRLIYRDSPEENQ